MAFTDAEVAYMRAQPLARIATVDQHGQPDVVPVGFDYDGAVVIVNGFDPEKTRRHHNIADGNNKVAVVIDDLVSTAPWSPRYLRIYGTAKIVTHPRPHLQITPRISWSWNLTGAPLGGPQAPPPPHRTVHND